MNNMNKKINVDFKEKLIPVKFVTINKREFNANRFKDVIDDFYDDDINDYNLDTNIANYLCEIGILKKRPCCKMATLYSKTEKYEEFYKYFNDLYYK